MHLKIKIFWKILHINSRALGLRGGGVLLCLNTILQKSKILSGIHLNIWKYNVCGIKLEMKVLHLHKIRV